MSLIPGLRCMAGHYVPRNACDEALDELCRLYPEIGSWSPPFIAEAWHQWRVMHGLAQAVPEGRDEAFPLYLVRLIRHRMDEMIRWCS